MADVSISVDLEGIAAAQEQLDDLKDSLSRLNKVGGKLNTTVGRTNKRLDEAQDATKDLNKSSSRLSDTLGRATKNFNQLLRKLRVVSLVGGGASLAIGQLSEKFLALGAAAGGAFFRGSLEKTREQFKEISKNSDQLRGRVDSLRNSIAAAGGDASALSDVSATLIKTMVQQGAEFKRAEKFIKQVVGRYRDLGVSSDEIAKKLEKVQEVVVNNSDSFEKKLLPRLVKVGKQMEENTEQSDSIVSSWNRLKRVFGSLLQEFNRTGVIDAVKDAMKRLGEELQTKEVREFVRALGHRAVKLINSFKESLDNLPSAFDNLMGKIREFQQTMTTLGLILVGAAGGGLTGAVVGGIIGAILDGFNISLVGAIQNAKQALSSFMESLRDFGSKIMTRNKEFFDFFRNLPKNIRSGFNELKKLPKAAKDFATTLATSIKDSIIEAVTSALDAIREKISDLFNMIPFVGGGESSTKGTGRLEGGAGGDSFTSSSGTSRLAGGTSLDSLLKSLESQKDVNEAKKDENQKNRKLVATLGNTISHTEKLSTAFREELVEGMRSLDDVARGFAFSLRNNLQRSFGQILKGSQDLEGAIGSVFSSLKNRVLQSAANIGVNSILSGVVGGGGSGGGGSGGSSGGGVIPGGGSSGVGSAVKGAGNLFGNIFGGGSSGARLGSNVSGGLGPISSFTGGGGGQSASTVGGGFLSSLFGGGGTASGGSLPSLAGSTSFGSVSAGIAGAVTLGQLSGQLAGLAGGDETAQLGAKIGGTVFPGFGGIVGGFIGSLFGDDEGDKEFYQVRTGHSGGAVASVQTPFGKVAIPTDKSIGKNIEDISGKRDKGKFGSGVLSSIKKLDQKLVSVIPRTKTRLAKKALQNTPIESPMFGEESSRDAKGALAEIFRRRANVALKAAGMKSPFSGADAPTTMSPTDILNELESVRSSSTAGGQTVQNITLQPGSVVDGEGLDKFARKVSQSQSKNQKRTVG